MKKTNLPAKHRQQGMHTYLFLTLLATILLTPSEPKEPVSPPEKTTNEIANSMGKKQQLHKKQLTS